MRFEVWGLEFEGPEMFIQNLTEFADLPACNVCFGRKPYIYTTTGSRPRKKKKMAGVHNYFHIFPDPNPVLVYIRLVD